MTNYRAGFQGQYIAAVDFGVTMPAEPTLTIKSVPLEKVEQLKGDDSDGGAAKVRDRWIVYCEESPRGWVMNRTNAICLAALFGDDVEGWVGHKVTLHAMMVQVGPKKDLGIRIKGSPELTAPKQVQVKLPRKKAITMTLQPTGARAAPQTTDISDPTQPWPARVSTLGEVVALISIRGWTAEAEAAIGKPCMEWSNADGNALFAFGKRHAPYTAPASGFGEDSVPDPVVA